MWRYFHRKQKGHRGTCCAPPLSLLIAVATCAWIQKCLRVDAPPNIYLKHFLFPKSPDTGQTQSGSSSCFRQDGLKPCERATILSAGVHSRRTSGIHVPDRRNTIHAAPRCPPPEDTPPWNIVTPFHIIESGGMIEVNNPLRYHEDLYQCSDSRLRISFHKASP